MFRRAIRTASRTRPVAIIATLVIGLSLVAAPAVFQMFGRAPLGGTMIDEFHPFMTASQVSLFRGYVTEVGSANAESAQLREDLIASGAITDPGYDTTFGAIAGLNEKWGSIEADMTDLLDRMDRNLDNFAAVEALPPFPMFPWFFVVPGAVIALVAASILVAGQRNRRAAVGGRWMLVGLGVALILAPVAFQMFSRAPLGRDMIDEFRPMMTRDRVQNVQSYFITMGAAEGQLRVTALPLMEQSGGSAADYPAIQQFSADWPTIVKEFNPMIGTMNDNLDNYAAVDALPSFALFPWFFVVPGTSVAALAFAASRRARMRPPPSTPE